MANSKTFVLMNGVTIEKIGEHLVTWFQNTKNMVSEGGRAQGGGYFVQAKDQDDGWKKISGLTKAIQVQLIKAENNVIVNCVFGKWSDKVGAGAVGMFLFAPLAATAAFGAVKQSQLPNEVFAEIERFIMYGGTSVVVSMGGRLKENEVECPSCGAKNPKGQKFCKECGSKLGKTCPNCGASVDSDTKFCPECGGLCQLWGAACRWSEILPILRGETGKDLCQMRSGDRFRHQVLPILRGIHFRQADLPQLQGGTEARGSLLQRVRNEGGRELIFRKCFFCAGRKGAK